MKIYYQDEYGVVIHTSTATVLPQAGDTVIFQQDTYRVSSVAWMIELDQVVVSVTQNQTKLSEKDTTTDRLSDINAAIIAVGKRVDHQEKKGRLLSEQLVSVRTQLRQKAQK